jgi:hypothetical protein
MSNIARLLTPKLVNGKTLLQRIQTLASGSDVDLPAGLWQIKETNLGYAKHPLRCVGENL